MKIISNTANKQNKFLETINNNQILSALMKKNEFFSLALTVIMFLILAIFTPGYFFNINNLDSLQAAIAPSAIIGIGMMLLIITGVFDLSVGSVMGLSGIVCGYFLSNGYSVLISVLSGLAVGLLIGLINGLLVAYAQIPALIVTIGSMYIFKGISETIMTKGEGYSFIGFPQGFLDFGSMKILGLYTMTWICIILLVIFSVFLSKLYAGRVLYYIGGNLESSASLGFDIKKVRVLTFTLSGFLSSVAGILSIARFQSVSRFLGQGIQMNIIIGCIIGGGSLLGGKGTVLGSLLGIAFVTLLKNAFTLFEINVLWQNVVIGAILVLVVVSDGYLYLKKQRELGKI
jgi:ribose transport system permease protein